MLIKPYFLGILNKISNYRKFMLTKIKNILKENFAWLESSNIFLESKLRNDLDLDSVSLINFQILIEDEFDVRFNPIEDDIAKIFYDISSLIDYLKSNKDV